MMLHVVNPVAVHGVHLTDEVPASGGGLGGEGGGGESSRSSELCW